SERLLSRVRLIRMNFARCISSGMRLRSNPPPEKRSFENSAHDSHVAAAVSRLLQILSLFTLASLFSQNLSARIHASEMQCGALLRQEFQFSDKPSLEISVDFRLIHLIDMLQRLSCSSNSKLAFR